MVHQRKLGIKPHLLKPDTPPHPQTHDLKKIMKKPRPSKKPSPPPNGASSATGPPKKPPPNYMKSTSSFEARKERSRSTPPVSPTPTPKKPEKSRKALRPSSLKLVKSPSFKPLRPAKKCSSVVLCEDLDAQRATCSSTLKDSKFPSCLELSPGGTELTGTSAMKVCPYTYCSLNGHHHAPAPPLKCFLSTRRRAMKTQKSLKLGCLSPQKKETDNEQVESTDFFTEIYVNEQVKKGGQVSKKSDDGLYGGLQELYNEEEKGGQDSRRSDVDRAEGTERALKKGDEGLYGGLRELYTGEEKGGEVSGCSDIDWEEGVAGDVSEGQVSKKGEEGLYGELQELYDEESVSSEAWMEEDGDHESDGSYQPTEIDHEVSSATTEADINDEMNEEKIEELAEKTDSKCKIDDQQETSPESGTVPDSKENSGGESDKQQIIIYNIIHFNIFFIKTELPETDKAVVKVPPMDFASNKNASESVEEKITSNEELCLDAQDTNNHSLCKERTSGEKSPDSSINLIRSKGKNPDEDMEDSPEFNPRGPNFLPEEPDPDAEMVDLRHQTMDERRNAEEWMVDFALQQAVTTLAPARKRKVALLVEAFEKVMPIPKYETHAPKAFTNARPMQACS